jgi:hypothetical protein
MAFPQGKCVIFEYKQQVCPMKMVVLPHRMVEEHLFIIDIFIGLSWILFFKFINNQIT